MGSELERHHAGDDQRDAEVACKRGCIAVEQNAYGKGADRPDAGPDGIGSADGDILLRQPQQDSADAHEHDRHGNARQPRSRILRHLEAHGPADLKSPALIRYNQLISILQ